MGRHNMPCKCARHVNMCIWARKTAVRTFGSIQTRTLMRYINWHLKKLLNNCFHGSHNQPSHNSCNGYNRLSRPRLITHASCSRAEPTPGTWIHRNVSSCETSNHALFPSPSSIPPFCLTKCDNNVPVRTGGHGKGKPKGKDRTPAVAHGSGNSF